MQDEQLQNGAIGTDPNENVQEETVAEGQDLAVQDGPGDAETLTEDTKEEVAEEAVSAE